MTLSLSRAIMTVAARSMGAHRRSWSDAMLAEYDVAAADGRALSFAAGCLVAAGRELLTSARGRYVLTTYAVALGVMMPMAALQLACVVFGLSYLYPGHHGLAGALFDGMASPWMLRGFYQAAGPVLALLQLALAIGHWRLAWVMLERDWPAALRWSARTLAVVTTLIVFMGALFIDSRQALLLAGIVGIECGILAIFARWHAELCPVTGAEPAG
jgi:hypothetical protein